MYCCKRRKEQKEKKKEVRYVCSRPVVDVLLAAQWLAGGTKCDSRYERSYGELWWGFLQLLRASLSCFQDNCCLLVTLINFSDVTRTWLPQRFLRPLIVKAGGSTEARDVFFTTRRWGCTWTQREVCDWLLCMPLHENNRFSQFFFFAACSLSASIVSLHLKLKNLQPSVEK